MSLSHEGGDSGVLELRGLRLLGCHGMLPEENYRAQPFEVDVDIHADIAMACRDDDMAGTVDYGLVCEAVRRVVEGPHVGLLERLAELVAAEVAREVVTGGAGAGVVEVTVRKLRPPVPFELASVGVRVRRSISGLVGA